MAENELDALPKTLTWTQIKFVIARWDKKSDKEAAEAIGISPQTVYNWPNKRDVKDVLKLTGLSRLEVARDWLNQLTPKAVGVYGQAMDDDKPLRDRIRAAGEVLDRAGLAAKGQLDVTLDVGLTDEERIERLAAIFDAARTRRDRSTDQA